MKILPIMKYTFQNHTNKYNNTDQYRKNNNQVFNNNLMQDTVTFSAKIPSIVTPTMEDLINRTKASDVLRYNILRLAKYDIPCPVCGHLMFDVEKFREFEKKILSQETTKEILDSIGEYKKYLHPTEKKMFSIMREDNSLHPDRTLFDMLKLRLPTSERRIIQQQTTIFTNIGLLSRKLPIEECIQVQELLNETYSRILDPRETSRFSRKIFLIKLKYAFIPKKKMAYLENKYRNEFDTKYQHTPCYTQYNKDTYVDTRIKSYIATMKLTNQQNKILTEARTLPTASNSIDAFIVKYAKRNYKGADPNKKIALRMLSNALATVEHIKPQSKKGGTEPPNLAIVCACDNNGRGSEPIIEQIIENPQMIINYPKYMGKLCKIHKMGKVEKSWITQHNRTYNQESAGILNADLTKLRQQKRSLKNKLSTENIGTPTKAERRMARKLKLKSKKNKKRTIR